MRTKKWKKAWFQLVVLFAVVCGGLSFAPNVGAAVTEGDILNGHAVVPTDRDVASSKYAVIAKYGPKSKLILSGTTTKKSNRGRDLIVEPKDSQKGKIKALYTNVATYKGRSLDFELVADDWKKAGFKGGEFFLFYTSHIGFNQGGYDYVSLRGTYLYSDTGKPATDLTGSYMTVNDLDANQFMTFDSKMMSKIDKIYAYKNSRVSYWKTNGKTNIGARFYQAIDSDDEAGIITMLVSGYEFDFEWSKDWSRPSSNNNPYNLNKVLDWKNESSAQYFGYIGEKPVRTEILEPTKKIIDNGKQVESNTITAPENITYEVYHTVPSEYQKFYYQSYAFEDVIHGSLSIDKVRIFDSSDNDVTSRFTVTTSGQTVRAAAKSSSLAKSNFYGENYRFVIDVTAKATKKLVQYANGANQFTASNTATVTVDGKRKPTNNVTTTIKLPQTSVGMKKIQIYTGLASDGLPVRLDVVKKNDLGIYDKDTVKINLFEKHAGQTKKVATKDVALKDLDKTINMSIPKDALQRDTKREYEAVITDYDKGHIDVKSAESKINTDGHTAKEGTITSKSPFTGVVMTERELGKDMKEYRETITVSYDSTPKVKAGYGIAVDGAISYKNDKLGDVERAVDIQRTTNTFVAAEHQLIDKSLSYYDKNRTYNSGDTINVNLSKKQETNRADSSNVTYQLPRVFLEQQTGSSFTAQQKDKGLISGGAIDGGHKLFIPVWVNELGTYDLAFQSKNEIGSHHMKIDVGGTVQVYAYMFNHIDSETPDEDEILIHPMSQGENDFEW